MKNTIQPINRDKKCIPMTRFKIINTACGNYSMIRECDIETLMEMARMELVKELQMLKSRENKETLDRYIKCIEELSSVPLYGSMRGESKWQTKKN